MARAAGLLLALVGSAAGQSVGPYTAAAQADLITALPGAESSAYKNYGLRRSAYTFASLLLRHSVLTVFIHRLPFFFPTPSTGQFALPR
jgi:hypothetical protein